jgi:hypothetical protein
VIVAVSRLLVAASFGVAACGYSPLAAGVRSEPLSVHLSDSKVPEAIASDDVLAGARDELARLGALRAGGAYPRLEIEVLRVDEGSEGVIAAREDARDLVPRSRGSRVALVARGWVVQAPGAAPARDTGDLRSAATITVALDAASSGFQQTDALRSLGRRLGARIAAKVLGLPAPSDE